MPKRKREESDDDSSSSSSSSTTADPYANFLADSFGSKINDLDREFIIIASKRRRDTAKTDIDYFKKLPNARKRQMIKYLKDIKKHNDMKEPYMFKILQSKASLKIKGLIMRKLELAQVGDEYGKAIEYVESALRLPFGNYTEPPISKNASSEDIKKYLINSKKIMDGVIFGQEKAKHKIMQIIGQNISNKSAQCSVIGLKGPRGVGKCFGAGTEILMYPTGSKLVETIKMGDVVMGDDCSGRRVLGLGCGRAPQYLVEYISEYGVVSYFTANPDHILCLFNKERFEFVKITVEEYLKHDWDNLWGYSRAVIYQNNRQPVFPEIYTDAASRRALLLALSNQINGFLYEYNGRHISRMLFICRSLGYPIVNLTPSTIRYQAIFNPITFYRIRCSFIRNDAEYYGFVLDGNHQFMLKNCIVTHNTMLAQHGISQVLGKPYTFISLAGIEDESYLRGHGYTYLGSKHGKIASALMEANVMDPVIYFDELDKICMSYKGEAVMNALIHLTDPEQNTDIQDKYFSDLTIDISKCTIVFSYNDSSRINPILRDRITEVEMSSFNTQEKLEIANRYMLGRICKDIGIRRKDIKITNEVLRFIIERYTWGGGVRGLKKLLYEIVREFNLRRLRDPDISLPLALTTEMVEMDYLRVFPQIHSDKIHTKSIVATINGMYACDNGSGSLAPITVTFIPTNTLFDISITGYVGKIIQESFKISVIVAWNKVPESIRNWYMHEWKQHGNQGFHCHMCDGATPKDGPSAGLALSLAVLSLLTNIPIKNDIAITGEVDLHGNALPIGDLRDKLSGVKKAGIKLALYPAANQKEVDIVLGEYPDLVDESFKIRAVDHIDEAIPLILTKSLKKAWVE